MDPATTINSHDVGITIALKQKEREESKKKKKKTKQEPQKSSSYWWKELCCGCCLYGVCLTLPSICTVLYSKYTILNPLSKLAQLFLYILGAGRHEEDAQSYDVAIVLILTLTMAVVRITIVHLLMDKTTTARKQTLEALTRVKSIHLLSSSYPESLTPRASMSEHDKNDKTLFQLDQTNMPPPIPTLFGSTVENKTNVLQEQPMSPQQQQSTGGDYDNQDAIDIEDFDPQELLLSSLSNQGLVVEEQEEDSWMERSYRLVRRSSLGALGVEELDDDNVDSTATQEPINSVLVQQQQEQSPNTAAKEAPLPSSTTPARLNAAPRFATAIFRMLYTGITCTWVWLNFHNYNFWPPELGGTGDTKHCWDLQGGPVALPNVYDPNSNTNALLKLYFMVQASYHLHSLLFHLLTMVLLWYYKGDSQPYKSYWRSVLQHGVALSLIVGVHLFSATRRLGVVGSFALDSSSFFLHFLQLCINSPRPMSPSLVKWIHNGLVIPSFFYARFYIWPFVVWHSFYTESWAWLDQVSHTMLPGVAQVLLVTFHVLTGTLLVLNMILFKRLLNHPHLQRVWNDDNDNNKGQGRWQVE